MLNQNPADFNIPYVMRAFPADPAAGAQLVWPAPTRYMYELVTLEFRFVADANAANRTFDLYVQSGVASIHQMPLVDTIIASETHHYNMFQGCPVYGYEPIANHHMFPLPQRLVLNPGDILTVVATNIQATDQFDNVRLALNRWTLIGI